MTSSPLRPWDKQANTLLGGMPASPAKPAKNPPNRRAEELKGSHSNPHSSASQPTSTPNRKPSITDLKKPVSQDKRKDSASDIGDEIDGLLDDLDRAANTRQSPITAKSPTLRAQPSYSAVRGVCVNAVGCGAWEEKGQRPAMEDKYVTNANYWPQLLGQKLKAARAICGVFDGHSGPQIAEYAAKRLPAMLGTENWYSSENLPQTSEVSESLKSAFERVDAEIISRVSGGSLTGGSTGNFALLLEDTLYVANLGDSRAVLSSQGIAVALSEDHKPDLPREKERIEGLDGRVEWRGCWRVMGSAGPAAFRGLAVSRAFGDVDWKVPVPLVESIPDVTCHKITEDDEFLIIGCDGVWDVLSNQKAVDIARRQVMPSGKIVGPGGTGG
mmetsp:Transcript_20326/g.31754  ORF Transcript_20326/g.31754 Transcript_20326/m.31754 type:complete len:386 (+) Transcript_20326:123-1280(+)